MPVAAALNGVKGEVNTLSRKRRWASALDEALFDSNIDRQTLDAMMEAARESFPDFRRYMQAKARVLGLDRLAWYDISAPVGEGIRVWDYDDATRFIVEQFGTYSKQDERLRSSRLPRELGRRRAAHRQARRRILHARAPRRIARLHQLQAHLWRREHPGPRAGPWLPQHGQGRPHHAPEEHAMTLAETASIFCETIVRHAAMKDATPAGADDYPRASLQDTCQVVVDITSRFLFESRIFEKRRERELSVDEFCALMLDAQRETYGDGLDQTSSTPTCGR